MARDSHSVQPGTMIQSTEEAVFGLSVTFISCCGFQIFGKVIETFLTPNSAKHSAWKWKNISVSFVHAVLSSICALLW